MIERWGGSRLIQSSRREDPLVMAVGRASIECGCHGLTGTRLDTMEPVTVLRPCSVRHEPLVEVASAALRESLTTVEGKARYRDRDMLEVLYELLKDAESTSRAHSVS